ncbi:hypothetical protein LTR82_002167 [Friedmanniomyces endolithicus]|uniref:TauD/TfdA-like domain-containing protein n=1 Tax=Friedmanniomyces endolithicus TaxID=329885 RepID=A0AAN6FZL8_9PEZI|nr:hypothetical protein LTR82_002167 [Friedmanniomyces endolithicus]
MHRLGGDDGSNADVLHLTRTISFKDGTPLAGPGPGYSHLRDIPVLENGVLVIRVKNESVSVPGRWVRDVCACPQCRNQNTAQRQVNVFRGDVSRVTIASANVSGWPQHITVKFQDDHETVIPASVIRNRKLHHGARQREGIVDVATWTSEIQEDPPTVEYADVKAGPGMASLLKTIRARGFAFVDNMPATPEATESLLKCIGPIRNTHYGAFYDFTSDLSSKDTAYTSEALDLHTDNTYFTDPAGLQALHLLSHTDGTGGESCLVDGFAAAEQLYAQDKGAYLRLSDTGVYAHASGNDGVSIQPAQAYPTFTHSEQYKKLIQVRWNNADRAGVATRWKQLGRWYDAAAKFDAILNDQRNQYWFQLKPGRMLLFDNWRVLHGRAAFTGKAKDVWGYIE